MGKLPELYRDTNILRTLESEQKEFWFVKEFNVSDGIEKNNVFMGFEGVDTVAEYFLNGKKNRRKQQYVYFSPFFVGDVLERTNILAMHIYSAIEYAKNFDIFPYNVAFSGNYESLYVREFR